MVMGGAPSLLLIDLGLTLTPKFKNPMQQSHPKEDE